MNPSFRTGTVALALLATLAWLIAVAIPGFPDQAALSLGFTPARLSGAEVPWAAVPAILTPLSATIVHSGLMHLLFNMLVFVWCGLAVERVLGLTGVLILYVAGAYASALAQWAVDPMAVVPMVGASGAVSAVIGAFSLSFGRPKAFTKSARLNRWLNALWLLAAWIVLQVTMGWLAGSQGLLLATPAHIGGFIAGLLLQRPLLLWRYRKA